MIIECVPNFSEGRDLDKIESLKSVIASEPNIKLLHTDIGHSANRTVITFAGRPDNVVNAAFNVIKKAAEIIDMRNHYGTHPRIGATDVCPLIPISGISMKEVIALSDKLAEKVGSELKIPVYTYEHSSKTPHRKNLEEIRKGEYESLIFRTKDAYWIPDFGTFENYEKTGAIVIGARNFLIAYNINLITEDDRIAKEIASQIRESGKNKNNKRIPGIFKSLKAIGWKYPECNITQVSTNITDFNVCAMHEVYEKVKQLAGNLQTKTLGSEIIGLIPIKPLIDAGNFYTKYQTAEQEYIIHSAIKNLGLSKLHEFHPKKRIIEYLL